MQSMENANNESHYKFLVFTIVIGLLGCFVRFFDFPHASAVANVLLAVGAAIALKAVFKILD